VTELNPPKVAERLSPSAIVLCLAGALAFLYLRTFLLPSTPFIDTSDQVLFFSRATHLVHGRVLYRDVFEFVTPGTDLIYAAAFRLFGIHAWIMQAWAIVLGLAFASVITWIASRILQGPLILFPALLFLVFDFSSELDLTHHWYSTLATLAAVGVLMSDASLRRICAAGSLCAIATLFTQTQGVMTFVALAVYLLWLRYSESEDSSIRTQLAALVLPFVLVVSCVLGSYVFKAGFRTLFFDFVVFPLRFWSSRPIYLREFPPLQSATDIVRLIFVSFIYAINPYIYPIGLYQLWKHRNNLPAALRQRLVLLHLVGVALFIAVATTGPSVFRVATVTPPAILICTWLLTPPSPVLRLARNLLCTLALILAVLLPLHRQTQWHAILNLPTGRTAFTDPLVHREFQWVSQRTHPGDLFFNNSAIYLYLSLTNPAPVEFVNYDDFTRPEQVSAVIESLQRNPPRFVVLVSENTAPSHAHDHTAPFRQYVHDNYRLAQTFPLHGETQYEEQLWELASTAPSAERSANSALKPLAR
jgi:hypothetical protein